VSRVYVPTTLDGLAGFVAGATVPADAERFVADGPEEEDEYLALMSAADACPDQRRRVVVVAEVADADGGVPWRDVVAVHADAAERADVEADDDLGWFAVQEVGVELLG
jgi:hypothetical protein